MSDSGRRIRFFIFAILICFLSFFSCAEARGKERPIAENGNLDLSNWDFTKDGTLELNGDWRYYWKEFIPPKNFQDDLVSEPSGFIPVPGVWNGHLLNGNPLPAVGYITYHLRLYLPDHSPDLAIRIDDGQGSAYSLYWNGKLVAYNGHPGSSPEEESPEYLAQTSFVPHSKQVDLVMYISNHYHRNGGFQMPILLGDSAEIFSARDRNRITSAFLAGALLIMGLYHIGLFLFRKKEMEILWFSLTCIVITSRVLTSGERFIGELFRDVPWNLMVRIEYLSFYLGVPFMAMFLRTLYPAQFNKTAMIVIFTLSIPPCLSIILLPPAIFSYTLPYYQGLIVFSGIYSMIMLTIAIFKGLQGAKLMLLGLGIFFAAVLNDFIFYQFHIGPGYLTPAGLFLLTFADAATLGRRIASAFNTSEELSVNLEKKVIERTKELAEERDRTDLLLLNILPKTVAEELKSKGSVTPVYYESASILFTDFVGFTKIAAEMLPKDLVEDLHNCFSEFDSIVSRYGLEKLKTIGDSYMCAGGIPNTNFTHAVDNCLAGLEFLRFMQKTAEMKSKMGLPFWELRVGIHTGPVTSGVIGSNKFAYDVWGDAVNLASRMESSGKPGYLNVSGSTYELIKDFFVCEHRGKIQAKGKGEVDMYFVSSIRPELSAESKGITPNEKFETLRTELNLKLSAV
ncbi:MULTISPECIES: adenylate/guanylate cyclase domain-containing protein [unclassified Leptospira]|uniref:adenylate/guanylate cyclase domain-containing protein n=1 Tax=unclassified Leptospira TaxID=2633828 RepID=UPI0002BF7BB5|nr:MULTISPECIES: adenylate/guanylate cyclase domain-containing protein [unclassified Leptospira]EMJ97571.1 adenylate/guanylate cyclase catalytic domain protein [Leptospira sp. B5-022]MCR1793168.1 guanylate cyclase [Leptospira sp. id769339]